MREDEVRDLLSRAGADTGPPLRIDADTVLRRGRRIRHRRHQLVVAGSSTATIAAVVVALVLVHPTRDLRPVQPANQGTVPATTTNSVPPETTHGFPTSRTQPDTITQGTTRIPPPTTDGSPVTTGTVTWLPTTGMSTGGPGPTT